MKKCQFCAEEIQDAAIICRYCGRDLSEKLPSVNNKKSNAFLLYIIPVLLIMVLLGKLFRGNLPPLIELSTATSPPILISTETLLPPTKTLTPKPQPTKEIPLNLNLTGMLQIIGQCEFEVKGFLTKNQVFPSNPTSFSIGYSPNSPDSYFFDFKISLKNLSANEIVTADVGSVKVIYNNVYNYDGYPMLEIDNGANLAYPNISSINPLSTGMIHYMVEIPKSLDGNLVNVEAEICGKKAKGQFPILYLGF